MDYSIPRIRGTNEAWYGLLDTRRRHWLYIWSGVQAPTGEPNIRGIIFIAAVAYRFQILVPKTGQLFCMVSFSLARLSLVS